MSRFATQMRPRTLSEFVGNREVFGPGGLVERAFQRASGKGEVLQSVLLSGPPGSGKTSFAEAYVELYRNYMASRELQVPFQYVLRKFDAGDFSKEALQRTLEGQRGQDVIPVVFIDEIHLLTKTRQATLLSLIEQREVVLLGSTNAELFRKVDTGLRSRCLQLNLKPLTPPELVSVLVRALNRLQPVSKEEDVCPAALAQIALLSQGDARKALSILEAAVGAEGKVTEESVGKAAATFLAALENKDVYYDSISALQKSIRASDPNAALFYLAALLETGADPMQIARRLCVIAAEDVGLANPNGLNVAVQALETVRQLGLPDCAAAMARCAVYLADAPKDNSANVARSAAKTVILQQMQALRPVSAEGLFCPTALPRLESRASDNASGNEAAIFDPEFQKQLATMRFWETTAKPFPQ